MLLEADTRFTAARRDWMNSGSDDDLFRLLAAYRRADKDIPDDVWEAYSKASFKKEAHVTKKFLKEFDTLVKVLKPKGLELSLSEPYHPNKQPTGSPYRGRIIGRKIEWVHHNTGGLTSNRKAPWIWAHRNVAVKSTKSIGATDHRGNDWRDLGQVTLSYSAEGNEWYRLHLWKKTSGHYLGIAGAWVEQHKIETIIKRAILALPGHKVYGHPMDSRR